MMKNTFAKKALLMGATAMLLSTIPVQAMDTARTMQKEVMEKTQHFAQWSKDALQKRLTTSKNFLNRQWKDFMRCTKEKGGCTPGQKRAIKGTIGTILAIIGALTIGVTYKKVAETGLIKTGSPFLGPYYLGHEAVEKAKELKKKMLSPQEEKIIFKILESDNDEETFADWFEEERD